MEERAWVDMGRDYLRRDEQWDAAPTADDRDALAEDDGAPGDTEGAPAAAGGPLLRGPGSPVKLQY
jgi:hypothetical protein